MSKRRLLLIFISVVLILLIILSYSFFFHHPKSYQNFRKRGEIFDLFLSWKSEEELLAAARTVTFYDTQYDPPMYCSLRYIKLRQYDLWEDQIGSYIDSVQYEDPTGGIWYTTVSSPGNSTLILIEADGTASVWDLLDHYIKIDVMTPA